MRVPWLALPLVLAPAISLAAPPLASCRDGALVVRDGATITAVDEVRYAPGRVAIHGVTNHSMVSDIELALRDDGTVAHARYVRTIPGDAHQVTFDKDLPPGAVYFSDRVPSTLELAIRRARILGIAKTTVVLMQLTEPTQRELTVERASPTEWHAQLGARRYDILTDESGCLIAATLPHPALVFERLADVPAAARAIWPPYAAPPDGAYAATDVRIAAPEGHVLAGTLTLPSQKQARYAAAVLITGISKHERNQGSPPFHLFRDLADQLSRAGIAVLRVDDRGVGASTGSWEESTTLTEAADVHTEIAWLRARPEIDPARVAVVGVSEGGLLTQIVAAEDPRVAAVVALAAPGVPGMEVYRYQVEAEVVRDPKIAPADREAAIRKVMSDDGELSKRERLYLSLDPLAWAGKVHAPSLLVQGANDLHVPPWSAERIAARMRAGGNRDVTVLLVPDTSHAFIPDSDGRAGEWVHAPSFRVVDGVARAVERFLSDRLLVPSRAR